MCSAGLAALSNMAFWASGQRLNWFWGTAGVLQIALWFAAIYVSASGIVRRPSTWLGGVRFALTSLALVLPLGATLLLLLAGKAVLSDTGVIWLLIACLITSFLIVSLLPAWPMAQSLSRSLVSPIKVLKATRGHRGSLILLAFATSGIGRAGTLPAMAASDSAVDASLVAFGNALIGLILTIVFAGIAAVTWQFAVRNDATLAP